MSINERSYDDEQDSYLGCWRFICPIAIFAAIIIRRTDECNYA